jgi:CubicO group peptidase (beta-lactamase class C family)
MMDRRQFMRKVSRAAVGLAFLQSAGCVSLTQAPRKNRTPAQLLIADLERQVPGWLKDTDVPGLSMAVIDRGKLAWRRGFGAKDAASKALMTGDTILTCCSMTKPVFAYFVMKLHETGVLDLDTPLTKFTPERYLQDDPRLDLITARHCLSHTTGFQNWREEDHQPLSIHFTPGTQWSYSGEGYAYLASVVTRLMRQPLEDYMQAHILSPFGMSSSAYIWTESIGKRMAWPHDRAGRPLPQNKDRLTHESVARYGAASDLLTTPTNYAKFLIEVIDPKPEDAFRLTRASRDEMLRPQVKVPNGQPPSSWALGWQIFHDDGRDFIYHGGDDSGWHTAGVACAANKSGYVAMTNGDNGTEILERLILSDSMQGFLRA